MRVAALTTLQLPAGGVRYGLSNADPRHYQPEGRLRQDDRRHQPGRLPGPARAPHAPGRPRPAGPLRDRAGGPRGPGGADDLRPARRRRRDGRLADVADRGEPGPRAQQPEARRVRAALRRPAGAGVAAEAGARRRRGRVRLVRDRLPAGRGAADVQRAGGVRRGDHPGRDGLLQPARAVADARDGRGAQGGVRQGDAGAGPADAVRHADEAGAGRCSPNSAGGSRAC